LERGEREGPTKKKGPNQKTKIKKGKKGKKTPPQKGKTLAIKNAANCKYEPMGEGGKPLGAVWGKGKKKEEITKSNPGAWQN